MPRQKQPRRAAPTPPPLPDAPIARVRWRPCHRIVPSRFPPVDLFERVTDPADLEAVIAVESLTNDRLRDAIGEIALVPPAERAVGAGASFLMAPFTHVNSGGSRFADGSFGAYYAAREVETAVAETVHHRSRFMAATHEPPMTIEMRVLEAALEAPLHDLRASRTRRPELYDPDDYTASQAFGRLAREGGSCGIAYQSVRRAGGECVAVFRPRALARCRQAAHLVYVWDGERIAEVYEKRRLEL